jgi:CRP/FNR family transcriptional regulator, cyclic AMP receptor protein
MGGYDEGVYRMYLGQVPMFAACSDAQIEEVRRLAEFRPLDPGSVIVREGETGEEFFILGSGEASVIRGGAELARLGPGDFFGELSLFDPAPRNATVTAASGVTVLALGRDAFRALLNDLPGFRESVLSGMARRLHDLDAKA